jgi:ATP-dependent DNA helicase RecG
VKLDLPLDSREIDLGQHAPRKLADVGIRTYRDLLYYFPRRYEDRRTLPHFGALAGREEATVAGRVLSRQAIRGRRGVNVLRATLEDTRGGRLAVVWFNQPWLEKQLFPGQRLIVTGKLKLRGSRSEMSVQDFEIDDDSDSLSTGRIVPVYPATQGLSQAYLRRATHQLLAGTELVPDHLPRSIIERFDLLPLDRAARAVHFPEGEEDLQAALHRLRFDEFLFLELRILLNRDTDVTGRTFRIDPAHLEQFRAVLPFPLTGAQERVIGEIHADMGTPRQMARLLQGDVGSGKTAVAAAAIHTAVANGMQAALMAPTEILARQHFMNLQQYLYPLGVRSELLTGSQGTRERREAHQRIRSGEAGLITGTHALIQEGVEFADLGLAIIDEEHRFGVEQRRKLLHGVPDVLVMSATPIPRSLALTYYGDLDLSVIDELPPGRTPVVTRLVQAGKRREVYRFAWQQIRQGRQVFLVTPLVEDSEALDEIVSSTRMYEELRQIMPEGCRLGLLHGRMTAAEKDAVMDGFRRQETDLLVSTTVIEVGVDVPNATVMIIENAERFGLSQLHQLRGRVGRGAHESYCILVAGDRSSKTQQRLEIIAATNDGHEIAEQDLKLRGPGELRGTRQSGLPDLVLGDLTRDIDIIERARELALQMLEAEPKLEAGWASRIREELRRRIRAVSIREVI